MEIEFSEQDLSSIAQIFWKNFPTEKVFAFHAEMGVGKTTLIHALCEALQVKDAIGSPTFSIINQYEGMRDTGPVRIYHMDLYRLRDEEEAARAGVEDALYSGDICLVEWPDKAPGLFPEDTVHVHLNLLPTGKRRLQIGGN
jgi:tRNA threonylcarbamoyladenosine biosynthesis protein TsaE